MQKNVIKLEKEQFISMCTIKHKTNYNKKTPSLPKVTLT